MDFTVLEIDRANITPVDGWEYEEGGRRRPYLLQRFASCDNEEIAYHGVTRLLVNQKFKRYGNYLLWFKTFIFISFLAAMLYALAQAAQEHRLPTTLYNSDMRPFTGWDFLRFFCEIYVVLFWMSNLITESAEVIQVLFYARKEISDKLQEKKSRLQEEQERNLRKGGEAHGAKKKETKTVHEKKETDDGEVVPKPVDDDDGGRKSPGGTSIKSNVSDKSTKSTKSAKSDKSVKSDKSGGDSDASDKVDVDTAAKTSDGDKSDADSIGGKSDKSDASDKSDKSDKPDIDVAGGDDDSDASSMHLGSEKKGSDDGSDDDSDDDSDEGSSFWGDYSWDGDDSDDDYSYDDDDDDDDYDHTEHLKEEKKKKDEEKAKKEEADAEEPPEVEKKESALEKVKDALQRNLIVRVFLDYFQDWYNWLDVIGLTLLFILIIFRIIIISAPSAPYVEFQWVFATFAFAINAFRLTKLLSVFKLFGTYMRIIILILLKDVPKFLLLLFLTFFFFSTTLYLSFRVPIIIGEINGTNGTQVDYYITLFDLQTLQQEGLDTYFYVLIYPIRVLLEGNALEFNYVFDSFNIIAAAVYIVFLFLIIVVYLNVFIAQLSDTYADVKANAKKTVAKFRLEFIVQTQTTSLLALFFDFRKRFFDEYHMMEDEEWVDYFNAGEFYLQEYINTHVI